MSSTTVRPFADAHHIEHLGDGRFRARLDGTWAIGDKAFGGLLMVLMTKSGLARLAADEAPAPDPLAVAVDFLRAPDLGPVEITTDPLKIGRTVSTVAVRLHQQGRLMLHSTVTAGVLPTDAPRLDDGSALAVEPDPDALDPASAEVARAASPPPANCATRAVPCRSCAARPGRRRWPAGSARAGRSPTCCSR